MPSERRLHPSSILFRLAGQLKEFAVPLLAALVAGSRGGNLEAWAMFAFIPYAGIAIARYISLRYRFEAHELVVRSGILFRNERHIPYARIQNLDAIRNVLHRWLGVVDVRIDTGSGAETDARLSVITGDAYEDMRRRVFAERTAAGEAIKAAPGGEATAQALDEAPDGDDDALLVLPAKELIIHGLIENRGAVVIAAAFGLLWELGVAERAVERYIGETAAGNFLRDLARQDWSYGGLPWGRIGVGLTVVAGLIGLIRLFSIALAQIRLHDFRLSRRGDDLRAEYGLLTRVTATIPLRRIQTLTMSDGIIHRWFKRTSIRVDTAGGSGPQSSAQRRESLAPIIHRTRALPFIHDVLPELDLASAVWQPPDPSAVGRETRKRLLLAAGFAVMWAYLLQWWTLALFAALAVVAVVSARRYVAHLGWAVIDHAVVFKSGWLQRHLSAALITRIQNVETTQSPFDRRWSTARLLVDTAGASAVSHRVQIPYLPIEIANHLHTHLAAAAAQTAFRW